MTAAIITEKKELDATFIKADGTILEIKPVKKYTIMRSATQKVLSTDFLLLAESAIKEIGGTSHIIFNFPCIGDTRNV